MKMRLAALAVGGFLVGALAALAFVPGLFERVAPSPVTVGRALVGGPFSLIDHKGRRVTEKDFAGRHMLVLFGFTFCPDVCPSGLQVMSAALDKLGKKAETITPIFISLDPERDTPEQLAQYVASFHPRLVGLTGTPEEVDKAAKAYRVFYKKVRDEKSTAAYTIDHTALIYLMGPDSNYVAHFNHATSPDTLAERLGKLL
jgi:protein SCO1/2